MTCLHHVIERRADESPTAVAVETTGTGLDYRTLDRAANHLAERLRARGAGPGDLVAIYGRVRPETLVAVLAVLKAGAAYLPLDPGDPAARTRAVLASARPVLVLAVEEWAAQAGGLGVWLGVDPLVLGSEVLTADADRGPAVGRPEDLAYVLFTSGSTGRPKGVLVEHRNLVNYCSWVARANRVGGRVAPLPTVTRFTFDASVQQLLAPLTRGDAVWMVPEETATVPERLLAALGARPGAGLHCVPALWEEILLLIEERGTGAPALSSLFLGGEVVRPDLWRRTRAVLPRTAMANVYGPTEATVQATGGFQAPDAPLSAGHPVDGVTVVVLDESRRPVPDGEAGEIWLGGAGVARGYLDDGDLDGDLTARRFAAAADLGLPGDRFYRTGDRGCLLPDGSLRVLGRLDDQLKIRGFRIEPAEVETVLGAYAGVRSTAVVAPAEGPFTGQLCAAVCAENGVDPAVLLAGLRDAATGQLPPHLVPARWRVAESLPRTASGKVDRRAVATLFTTDEAAGRPLTTDLERAVAGIWSEVLGREVRSADDDFFALGGHSLLATRVAARTRRALGATNALRVLFDERTVGAVAGALEVDGPPQDGGIAGTGGTVAGVTGAPAPLSVQQEAIWAAETALAGTPFNHVLLPVSIFGPLEVPALTAAVEELVVDQPALRTRFDTADGTVTQREVPAEPVPVPVVDVRDGDRARCEARAMTEARALFTTPIDLGRGPLLRATLVRLAEEEWVLLLVTHHIVCDGVSLQVMLADLVAAYRRRVDPDGASRPAPPAPSYADFARAQRRRLAAGELDADLRYWRDKLRAPVVAGPLAPAPEEPSHPFRFGATAAPLGASLVARMTEFGRREGATPFMCLAAALAALVHRRTGARPVRLGTLAANRELDELSRAVGTFATTVVLGFTVSAADTYRDLVRTARAEVLAGQEHQRVPLELAVSGAAPFQVGLSWEPARPAETVGRTGFAPYRPTAEGIPLPVTPSSTDLSVIVAERGAELVVTAEYRMSTMDTAGAAGFLHDLYTLLADALSTPDVPVVGLAVAAPGGRP